MKHLSPLNSKARRLVDALDAPPSPAMPTVGPAAVGKRDVVALEQTPQQPQGPHIPLGCSTLFAPGWEVDRTGGTAGLCQPVERDLFDCHLGCFWPAQVPDQLNHAPDWTKKCAAAQKDWRQIDIIFP
jgi:hypothetical protein